MSIEAVHGFNIQKRKEMIMSNQTEKAFKEMYKFFDENGGIEDKSKDEAQKLINEFMEKYNKSPRMLTESSTKTADDFFELASSASSKKNALKYAKKAVELDPNHIDAAEMVAQLSATSIDNLLSRLEKIIASAEVKLKEAGLFEDDAIGDFWLIFQTRPYMRLLDSYALIDCGRMRAAIAVCEKMLKLCKNDNLGERYRLMHLYAYLEDEDAALALVSRYPEEKSTQFLLPLSVLYYKLGNLPEAERYLKSLSEVNEDTALFFDCILNGKCEEYVYKIPEYGYRVATMDELLIETDENTFLFRSVYGYYDWANRKLRTKREPKAGTARK